MPGWGDPWLTLAQSSLATVQTLFVIHHFSPAPQKERPPGTTTVSKLSVPAHNRLQSYRANVQPSQLRAWGLVRGYTNTHCNQGFSEHGKEPDPQEGTGSREEAAQSPALHSQV